MRIKTLPPVSIKLLLLCIFLVFLLCFILLKASFFPSPNPNPDLNLSSPPLTLIPSCNNKIPTSLAKTLIHYATSNTTPQQTLAEISIAARVLDRKSPCNFLVFGLGHDSLMWSALNHGGRTLFLEENKGWIEQIHQELPDLEAHHVTYSTTVDQADQLLRLGIGKEECKEVTDPRRSGCEGLALKSFPAEVYEVQWDVVMVDAPTGYYGGAPGRMSAIYTAGVMARNREEGETHVFVHDADRVVEDRFSRAFLCEGYLTEQEGRLRHFTIPSHRSRSGRPFCPP